MELGASPRAALSLFRAAQALAAMRGRAYALPDDVKAKLEPQGMELTTTSPADLARLIRQDYAKWGKVIKEADIRGD